MGDDITPPPPKLSSSPTGLVVPTNGRLGSSTVTQSLSSSSSSSSSFNENALLVVDSSSATMIGTTTTAAAVTTITNTTTMNLMDLRLSSDVPPSMVATASSGSSSSSSNIRGLVPSIYVAASDSKKHPLRINTTGRDTNGPPHKNIRCPLITNNDTNNKNGRYGTTVPSKFVQKPTDQIGTTATATATERVLMNDFLLRTITSYLPNEHLMEVACVSKRWNHIIPRATTYESRAPGTIITVLHMSPSPHSKFTTGNDGARGRLEQLVHQLQQLCGRDPNVLQQYQHASMKDYQEFFDQNYGVSSERKYRALVHQIKTNGPRIEGITSLDFCFSTAPRQSFFADAHNVLRTLSYLFPSLQQVDFTNTYVGHHKDVPNRTVQLLFENCPLLEKLTINSPGFSEDGTIELLAQIGTAMKTADNLKELTMDDSRFLIDGSTFDVISDLDTDHETVSKQFLFHGCSSNVLERVSMCNTKICVYDRGMGIFKAIPQNALINFIRKAPPSLRWFRSNLTQESIKIVQQERPEIEFVS